MGDCRRTRRGGRDRSHNRERQSEYGGPETIEETAELVTGAGGKGIVLRVDGLSGDRSPDRLDALVLALTALILGRRRAEGAGIRRIRGLAF